MNKNIKPSKMIHDKLYMNKIMIENIVKNIKISK